LAVNVPLREIRGLQSAGRAEFYQRAKKTADCGIVGYVCRERWTSLFRNVDVFTEYIDCLRWIEYAKHRLGSSTRQITLAEELTLF